MVTEFFSSNSLSALISHHIALIQRFEENSDEEFALLFLHLENFDNIEIKKSIQIVFRDTDIIFNHNENFIILLPKTDWNGAYELLNGLQEFLDQELQDSIATYPDDGKDTKTLIESFKRVVNKYYDINLEL